MRSSIRETRQGRWVVILSTARSGSTLLSVMLGANSRVIAPPELHLLRQKTYMEWRKNYPEAINSLLDLLGELDTKETVSSLDKIYANTDTTDIYREVAGLAGAAGHWLVDKSPSYGRLDSTFSRLEEIQPHYIWLVRHPLAVAASRIERQKAVISTSTAGVAGPSNYLRRLGYAFKTLAGIPVRNQLEYWKEVHGNFERFLSGVDPARQIRVHFEALVGEPGRELERICSYLGLEIEPAMFNTQVSANRKKIEWGLGDEKIRQHSGVNPDVANSWRRQMSESLLDKTTLDMMKRLGVHS